MSKIFNFTTKFVTLFVFLSLSNKESLIAQGNYVSEGGEFTNYGILSLSTSSSWATARTASPGYFSAYGLASYTDADDTRNVNGYVKHYVQAANQGFTFPVGTGTDLRTLTTSGTIPNGVVYGTAWMLGNPSTTPDPTDAATHSTTALGAGISAVSTVGQWDWVVASGSAVGVTITVSIPNLTAFGSAANLRLVGWNGSQWINLSGTTGASSNTENSTLSGTIQANITALGIGLSSNEIQVSAKVFLQGPLNPLGTTMTTTLSTQNLIPLTDSYGKGATTTTGTLTGNAVTDWVLVELRTTPAVTTAPVESIAALLKNDGTLINPDGSSPLKFTTSSGSYYVSVRHRNHLGVMTAAMVSLSNTAITIDFTNPSTATFGSNAQATVGSVKAMWAGNSTGLTSTGIDNVRYSNGDINAITGYLTTQTGSPGGVKTSVYTKEDTNLDGTVRYSGGARDILLITNTILGYPTNPNPATGFGFIVLQNF